MIPSMSGKGNCYDNTMVETVLKTIKSELVWRTSFLTRRQAKKGDWPLHRRVLQSDAKTFRTRLHLAHQVRGRDGRYRLSGPPLIPRKSTRIRRKPGARGGLRDRPCGAGAAGERVGIGEVTMVVPTMSC